MSQTLGVREAEARFSELLERAVAGEDIVITRGGEAVAKIVAIKRKSRKQPEGVKSVGFSEIAAALATLRSEIATGAGHLNLSTILDWRDEGRH